MARYLTYTELCDRATLPIIGKSSQNEGIVKSIDKALTELDLSLNEDGVKKHFLTKEGFYDRLLDYLKDSCYDLDTAISVMVRLYPEVFIGELYLLDDYGEEIMFTNKQLEFILDGAKRRKYMMHGRMATHFVPNRRKIANTYLLKFIPHIIYNDQLCNYEMQITSGEYFRVNENLPYGQSEYFIDALRIARDFLQTISETKDHVDEHPEDFE